MCWPWSSTKQTWHHHHHHFIECNLFSPWYSWKIAHLALEDNHPHTHIPIMYVCDVVVARQIVACELWCNYRSLQVYQRSYSQVGHRVLLDLKRVSLLKSSDKMSDKILTGRSESIPCQSESLHSQIVTL